MVAQDSLQATEQSISMLDLVFNGSLIGILIILILFILFGLVIYLYVERMLYIKNCKELNELFLSDIETNLSNDNYDGILVQCDESDASPLSRLMRKAIVNRDMPYDHVVRSIGDTVAMESHQIEKNVNLLATIAGSGPMIGFLGTVIGMILSFYDISISGGQADMGVVASGIYTAMTTTVAGLIVGITAHLGYNHLVMRIQTLLHDIQVPITDFIDHKIQ